MSPTFAASGLVRLKREVREPVGSRRRIWVVWRAAMGSVMRDAMEGGGAMVFILLLTGWTCQSLSFGQSQSDDGLYCM